jgi:hypothetical protein
VVDTRRAHPGSSPGFHLAIDNPSDLRTYVTAHHWAHEHAPYPTLVAGLHAGALRKQRPRRGEAVLRQQRSGLVRADREPRRRRQGYGRCITSMQAHSLLTDPKGLTNHPTAKPDGATRPYDRLLACRRAGSQPDDMRMSHNAVGTVSLRSWGLRCTHRTDQFDCRRPPQCQFADSMVHCAIESICGPYTGLLEISTEDPSQTSYPAAPRRRKTFRITTILGDRRFIRHGCKRSTPGVRCQESRTVRDILRTSWSFVCYARHDEAQTPTSRGCGGCDRVSMNKECRQMSRMIALAAADIAAASRAHLDAAVGQLGLVLNAHPQVG